MRELLAATTNLPDPVIGLIPDGLQMEHQFALKFPAWRVRGQARLPSHEQRVEGFPVDVELALAMGGVADVDGFGGFVAR